MTRTRPSLSSIANPPELPLLNGPVNVNFPVLGSNVSADSIAPFASLHPPATRTRPSLRRVAVCPSRGIVIEPVAVIELRAGSKIDAAAEVGRCPPQPPPTSRTRPSASRVAVPCRGAGEPVEGPRNEQADSAVANTAMATPTFTSPKHRWRKLPLKIVVPPTPGKLRAGFLNHARAEQDHAIVAGHRVPCFQAHVPIGHRHHTRHGRRLRLAPHLPRRADERVISAGRRQRDRQLEGDGRGRLDRRPVRRRSHSPRKPVMSPQ